MKDKLLSVGFILILFSLFFLNLFTKDREVSYAERRKLTSLPAFKLDKDTFDKFDNYCLDQFVFRNDFRKLKALVQLNLFHKQDNNGIFVKDGVIYKAEYPLNEKKVNLFVNKMNNLYNKYLKGMNIYYSIIPDKNYYLDDNHLKMDYDKLFEMVNNGLQDMKYIDITNDLTLDDYYRTDTHFKQDKIGKVVETLSQNMHFLTNSDYKIKTYKPFYGVYYGQAALNVKPDTLSYLTNEEIENSIVYDYESPLNKVYEETSLGKMDSYDVFLSGATPFITINNLGAKEKKELIMFRDSFGSTLAPLLISGYSKITLIDLRYMNMELLPSLIEFKNQDVLIIYNTLVINNSETIRD